MLPAAFSALKRDRDAANLVGMPWEHAQIFIRLFPEPHIDAFCLTLAGRLLLGRYFAWSNIFAYLIGIAITALADSWFRSKDSKINNR